jgi:subtilisin family serine protease
VLTTTPNASWAFVSGNSFATAHVSGIVALLLESSPGLKPKEIYALLHRHGGQTGSGGRGSTVDACMVLASLSGKRDCQCCGVAESPRARRREGIPPS